MDVKFQVEVLENNSQHVCEVAGEITAILTQLQGVAREQQGFAGTEATSLLDQLTRLQKMFSAETTLFDQRLLSFLHEAQTGNPSS